MKKASRLKRLNDELNKECHVAKDALSNIERLRKEISRINAMTGIEVKMEYWPNAQKYFDDDGKEREATQAELYQESCG